MDNQFEKKLNALLRAEKKNPHEPYYFSFATEKGFHGGVIINCRGPVDGLHICHRNIKISSNTSVQSFKIKGSGYEVPDEKYFLKKLTLEEIQEFWPDFHSKTGCFDYDAE
jgi:hypothetical protein